MILVREYRCKSGHVTERFGRDNPTATPCEVCGEKAIRQLSAPRAKLEGTTGAFPGAAMAWERKREQHMAEERRREREHGDSGWR